MAPRSTARRSLDMPESDWVDVNLSLLGERLPGLELSASHITARIFRLREIFIKALDRAHAQFGLKPRMFLVLAALYRSGKPYTLSPASLMRYLMWSSGGLSQLLDRMTKSGLITRHPDPNDRRGVLVTLSPAGERVIVSVFALHCRTELRLVSALSKAEQSTLVELLRKLLLSAEGSQVPLASSTHRRVRMKSVS
jgi:DNA-binding MarR family transcriptional regulator